MEFVKQNWDTIYLALTTTVTLASIIVKLTPSEHDDKIVMQIMNFLAINKKKDQA